MHPDLSSNNNQQWPLSFVYAACSLTTDPTATKGDSRIQKIIDALPTKCPSAGRDCVK